VTDRTLRAANFLLLNLKGEETSMGLTRRYTPEFAPGESCNFGMDYSYVIPLGVGIESGTLNIFSNTATPADAAADFTTIGPVTVRGRALYAPVAGGVEGKDYQLRWSATDTQGNVWPRTTLVLCAQTS
jgi:hypothetical protein